MVNEIIILIAAFIVLYFFKDIITILCILSIIFVGYMYFSGNGNLKI